MNKKDNTLVLLVVAAAVVAIFSLLYLDPQVKGDSISYLDSIKVLETGVADEGFVPNRIITTIGGLGMIIFFSKILGSIVGAWMFMNIIFYFISVMVFYQILKLIFHDTKTSFLGAMFFAGNYAIITFGLHFLMDIGGWTFYLASLFFTLRYAKFSERRDLLLASFFAGIGGLFKEYALLSIVPIAVFLIFENKKSLTGLIKKSFLPALLATIPIGILYLYVYQRFSYSYADWVVVSYTYEYSMSFVLRIKEYIKSLGSLYNLLAVYVLAGAWFAWKERNEIDNRIKIFIISCVLSCLPVLFWGGITQRILFITVPASIVVASFFFKKTNKYFYIHLCICLVYLVINLAMDSYILDTFNLPF